MKILLCFSLSFLLGSCCLNAQSNDFDIPKISIISAEAEYLGEVDVYPKPHKVPGENIYIGSPGFKTEHWYLTKIDLKIDEVDTSVVRPLFFKIIRNTRLLEDLSKVPKNEVLHFEIKTNIPKTGWYNFMLGDFSDNNNIIYEEGRIYISLNKQ